jgi:hypothetical protein|tara:strand:+ start:3668 stop:3919 length:252 start_codon:yes stop_codon:yes gene_type:complete
MKDTSTQFCTIKGIIKQNGNSFIYLEGDLEMSQSTNTFKQTNYHEMTLAGFPKPTPFPGKSLVTTDPDPTTEFSPITTEKSFA